jgi:hypothetical protein
MLDRPPLPALLVPDGLPPSLPLLPPEPANPVLAPVLPPELPRRPPVPPVGLLLLAGAVPTLPPTAEVVEPPPLDPPVWVLELEV